jgi:LeuA allosteric (dimerisation) domain
MTDPTPTAVAEPTPLDAPTLHLARWSCSTGSNTQSRGVVVITAGDHRWQATADGNGPIAALFRAVDSAVQDVLQGHPRLLAFNVHALSEGADAEARVTIELGPPSGAEGARSEGTYAGCAESSNIIAASVESYVDAINHLLAEDHWAGATEEAGNRREVLDDTAPATEIDRTAAGQLDNTSWFER